MSKVFDIWQRNAEFVPLKLYSVLLVSMRLYFCRLFCGMHLHFGKYCKWSEKCTKVTRKEQWSRRAPCSVFNVLTHRLLSEEFCAGYIFNCYKVKIEDNILLLCGHNTLLWNSTNYTLLLLFFKSLLVFNTAWLKKKSFCPVLDCNLVFTQTCHWWDLLCTTILISKWFIQH